MDTRFSTQSPFGRAVFWLCLLAYGLHVIEEFDLGWQLWAVQVLGLPVTWGTSTSPMALASFPSASWPGAWGGVCRRLPYSCLE